MSRCPPGPRVVGLDGTFKKTHQAFEIGIQYATTNVMLSQHSQEFSNPCRRFAGSYDGRINQEHSEKTRARMQALSLCMMSYGSSDLSVVINGKIGNILFTLQSLNTILFAPSHRVDTPISLSFSRSEVIVAK